MQRKYSCEQPTYEQVNLMRRSTIGHQTEDLNHINYVIGEIVLQSNFKMSSFVEACGKYPQIKDETKLVHEIFLKPDFVKDLIRFLMAPLKMIKQFRLTTDEGQNYVTTIANFLRENYEFYEFYFLGLQKSSLGIEEWFLFLDDSSSSTFYTSMGYLSSIFTPIVKYEFSTSSRITEYFQKHYPEKGILLINHFSEHLLARLLLSTQFQGVFKILLNLVLISLQEQEWKRSLLLLKALCLSGVSLGATLDSHIENLFFMAREVSNNIDKDVHNTIFAFTDAFTQTNLLGASISRITAIFQTSQFLQNTGVFSYDEENALEYNLKLLAEIINIYFQLRSNGIDHLAGQMIKLKHNILQIYHSFDRIAKLFRGAQSKTINFSNGENVRSISIYKYQFLNLLRICLLLTKEHGNTCPELKLNIDKSQILEFLTRCLSQNRWNSIVHCLIQKIICLSINTEFFKTRSAAIRKFLSFLVKAFSNKKYMFLNSTKMINQGDIHSLYFISRKITVELDRMPAIVDSTSEFDFWKNFVLNVLQKYEDKNERQNSQIECEEEARDKDGDFKVEIDEVALIKEIVRKIEINKKWSFKRDSHSTMYRIGSASQLKKKRSSQKGDKLSTSKFRSSINQEKLKPYIQQLAEHTPAISSGCISSRFKETSSQDDLEYSVSNHSSEETALMLRSSHSDADQLDEEIKNEKEKMTQSGW